MILCILKCRNAFQNFEKKILVVPTLPNILRPVLETHLSFIWPKFTVDYESQKLP